MYVLELAGEDDRFAAAEAESAAIEPAVIATGVALATEVDERRARQLAFTHRGSRLVGRTTASIDAAERLLATARLASVGPATAAGSTASAAGSTAVAGERAAPATVAVRARDVRSSTGVSTSEAERVLGAVLVDRGFAVDLDDPDHELRALFAGDYCALGWFAFATERGYGARAPTDRPFFQPGSMDPLLARALVNLALPGPVDGADRTLLDPMCGTGGVLLEGGLVGARPLGLDAQRKMVRGTRQNLRAANALAGSGFEILRGDATRLPVRDGAVDAVVFDAPYGRQSKVVSRSARELVRDALAEARRVTRGSEAAERGDGDRVVVVGDRPLADPAEAVGFATVDAFERRVHRSLTRHVLVLE